MTIEEQLREALLKMAAKVGPTVTLLAKVLTVDETESTCVLQDDDTEIVYHNVRLRPVLDGNASQMLVPKEGTWALAVRIEDTEQYMLIACGETAKLISKIGTTTLQQSAGGFEIKKGNDSLKEVIVNMIEAVQQIVVLQGNNPDYAKLTTALTKTNNLLQ